MYIDIAIIESSLFVLFVLFIVLSVVAAIGWLGYIKASAKCDKLRCEKDTVEYLLRKARQRENIRVANEYNKEGE